jgi:hypothetical protein
MNKAAKAVLQADNKLTAYAMLDGSLDIRLPTQANIRPTSRKIGAPGGCTTWSLYAPEMNSPQSQRLPVGSAAADNTAAVIRNTSQPVMLFSVLNDCIAFYLAKQGKNPCQKFFECAKLKKSC